MSLPTMGRRLLTSGTQYGDTEIVCCNDFWKESEGAAIPKATLTFSTMPDLEMALLTLPTSESRRRLFSFKK